MLTDSDFITEDGANAYLAVLALIIGRQSQSLGVPTYEIEIQAKLLLDDLLGSFEIFTLDDEESAKRLHRLFFEQLHEHYS